MTAAASAPPGSTTLDRWVYDNLEAVLIAVILALLLRQYSMEAFKIPTGSMAPRLEGVHREAECARCAFPFSIGAPTDSATGEYRHNGDSAQAVCPLCGFQFGTQDVRVQSGNRILVNKFIYGFREPERWEVIVFRYPSNPTQNYIKRCIARTGERVAIHHGDIYINDAIARKPSRVQDAVWLPVYDSTYPVDEGEYEPWIGEGWTRAANRLEAAGDSQATLAYLRPEKQNCLHRFIADTYGYEDPESGESKSENAIVGDFRLRLDFEPHGDGTLRLTIGEDRDLFTLHLRVSGDHVMASVTRARRQGAEMIEESFAPDLRVPLESGMNTVVFDNVDDSVSASVNERWICQAQPYESEPLNSYESNRVAVTSDRLAVILRNIRIDRDIHYLARSSSTLSDKIDACIQAGRPYYVGFGDHSPSSSDSREWGVIPAENLIGKAEWILWPPSENFPWLDIKRVR